MWKTARRLAKYLFAYPGLVALVFVLMLLGVVGEVVIPRLFGYTVDRGLASGQMSRVAYYTGLLAGAALLRGLANYFTAYVQELVGQNIVRDLRHQLYARLQRLSFAFYAMNPTGDLMSRLTSDVEAVQEFFAWGLLALVSSWLVFIATIIVLLTLDWRLTLVVSIPIPLLILTTLGFARRIGPAWERVRQQMGRLTTVLQESVSGVRVVKAFAREEYQVSKFGDQNVQNRAVNLGRADLEAMAFPLMDFLTGTCFILLIWYGGRQVLAGQLSLGVFFSYQWYLWGLIWPVRMLGWLVSIFQQAFAAAPRLFQILDSNMEIREKPGAVTLPPVRGHIRFEKVSFAFEDGDGQAVLNGLDLEVLPGQVVAVLGGTGSGKSSLINLIPRFYDPQEGRVTIDGYDIRDVTLDSLRRQIGIVPQETFLFSTSIRANIAFGRPEATDEEIEAAAKAAQIHSFITSLPKGYQSRVGERGIGLSGGQKQRVAIARALLVNPAILILDEATSSVDAQTEHDIQLALAEVMKGRTSIVIAQRLSTVKSADKIVVLKDGKVVEEGTHEELLAKGGEYAHIYELQFKQQEELANLPADRRNTPASG